MALYESPLSELHSQLASTITFVAEEKFSAAISNNSLGVFQSSTGGSRQARGKFTAPPKPLERACAGQCTLALNSMTTTIWDGLCLRKAHPCLNKAVY